jgi:hypothetical protein
MRFTSAAASLIQTDLGVADVEAGAGKETRVAVP